MATVIKLTDKVTEKLKYLKDLAGVDDSIIDQETKKEIAEAVSTIEQEMAKADNEKPESTKNAADTNEKDSSASNGDTKPVSKKSTECEVDWVEPEFTHEKDRKNLKWLTPDEIKGKKGIHRAGYIKYGMCFKDFSVESNGKPIYRNLISLIADNIRNYISDECYDELRESNMRLYESNNLVYSGLFIYKAYGGNIDDSVMNSDGHIDIWVPAQTEISQIKSRGVKAIYKTGDFFNLNVYPELRGYILDFESMKNILLNPDNIIYPAPCFHLDGLYDRHSALYRNTINNNLIYRDEDMALAKYGQLL